MVERKVIILSVDKCIIIEYETKCRVWKEEIRLSVEISLIRLWENERRLMRKWKNWDFMLSMEMCRSEAREVRLESIPRLVPRRLSSEET